MVFHSLDDAKQPYQGKKNPSLRKDYPFAYREWQRIVTKKMSHLSKPQAVGKGDVEFWDGRHTLLWPLNSNSFPGTAALSEGKQY